jgi:Lipopolysaccharide core biosynthesis protein (WaaY)
MFFIEYPDGTTIFDTNKEQNFIKKKMKSVGESHFLYKKYRENSDFYTQLYYILDDDKNIETLNNVAQIHKDLDYLQITPRLIKYEKLLKCRTGWVEDGEKEYFDEDDERVGSIYIYVTEKYGISLAALYMNLPIDKPGTGPGYTALEIINNDKQFNEEFPPDKIPEHIRKQIIPLLYKIKEQGWNYNDVHVGNFVVNNDAVKIIDFKFVTKRKKYNKIKNNNFLHPFRVQKNTN